jgi:SsrA-binding protein
MAKKRGDNVITENRRARFNYELLEFYEGGLVLTGAEIKSIRDGGATVNEAYASFSRGELWLIGAHIAPYKHAGQPVGGGFGEGYDERRSRKILLHKSELKKLRAAREQQGLTIVPTMLVWKKGFAKVVLAIGKGKKTVDKRETIKKRESEREVARIFKGGKRKG